MPPRLQECTLDDLFLLAEIAKDTFTKAFEQENNPDDFNAYLNTAFSPSRLRAELSNINSDFYFILNGSDLVGYLKLNENEAQTDIKSSEAIELERLYIRHLFQGLQIGHWTLNEIKKIALRRRKKFIWLGVWEKNFRAIEFYRRHGFSKFGVHPYYVGNDKQTDWLMRFNVRVDDCADCTH
ncbi:GNAT family N-acetyltransferase [Pareuzebyella sediminis]|uniref:GNAT family N-acetyltransferase n=1 Tax=Pareuzebyella sediminis TaxID=2607998 RepID=UPI0011EC064C|nr:GNAT family N-acetyltransferase [Pareuzebyella sediminis]